MRKIALALLAALPVLALAQAVTPGSASTNISGGTFNIPGSVSVSSLPATAATASNQTSGNQKAKVVNDAGETLGIAAAPLRVDPTGTTAQPVVIQAGTAAMGHVISDPTSVTSIYNGGNQAAVDASGNLSAKVTSMPAIAGSGTAGTPAGGVLSVQGVSGGTALPTALTVGGNAVDDTHRLPVDVGADLSVTIDSTGLASAANQTNGTQKTQVTSLPALASGSNTIGNVGVTTLPPLPAGANQIGAVTVANFPGTTAITATALPLPTGAATETTAAGINSKLAGTLTVSDTKLPSGLTAPTTAVAGTEAGLIVRPIPSGTQTITGGGSAGSPAAGVVTIQGITNGTPMPISGSITATNASVAAFGGAAPASGTALGVKSGSNIVAMAGDANGAVKVVQVDSSGNALTAQALGQAAMAASLPVALASDQSAIPVTVATVPTHAVTQGGTWNIGSVATLPALPAGTNVIGHVITDTGSTVNVSNTSFAVTNPGLPAGLGQGAMAASVPVAIASNQTAIPVSRVPLGVTSFQCSIPATSTATTQCAAAPGAGLNFYIVSATLSNGSTSQTLQITQGTGTSCTTPTAVSSAKAFNANAGAHFQYDPSFPWKGSLANASLCVSPSGGGAFGADIRGYIAP